jgi:hypothetical protein
MLACIELDHMHLVDEIHNRYLKGWCGHHIIYCNKICQAFSISVSCMGGVYQAQLYG